MLNPAPVVFPEPLRELAAGGAATRAVVAGAHSELVLEGMRLAAEEGWVEPVLVGPPDAVRSSAARIGWELSDVEVVPADGESEIAEHCIPLAADPACGMVVKGQIHTSALLRALLQKEAKVRTGRPLSHIFYLTRPVTERALAISDGALQVAPDVTARKAIIQNLVDFYTALGVARPRIALLAATEEVQPYMPATTEADELRAWAEQSEIAAEVFGPLALDAAVAPAAAHQKGITASPVAGHADALVVPTIEVGNAVTKSLIWFASACAAGIVMGGRIPITVPSRSDAPAARLAAIALARVISRESNSTDPAAS